MEHRYCEICEDRGNCEFCFLACEPGPDASLRYRVLYRFWFFYYCIQNALQNIFRSKNV